MLSRLNAKPASMGLITYCVLLFRPPSSPPLLVLLPACPLTYLLPLPASRLPLTSSPNAFPR